MWIFIKQVILYRYLRKIIMFRFSGGDTPSAGTG